MAYFNAPNERTSLLDRVLYADMKTYLVELLMKQDQMSMAASIESRVPFLDHHLVEFAAGLPADRKLSGLSTKRILREAVQDVLPRQILERPKMGFPVPFGPWLQNGWGHVVRDVLLDRRTRQRGIFEPAAVERLLTPAATLVEQPGRRCGVGALEPGALVPHVHRWRRRPDTVAAGRLRRPPTGADGARTPAVGVDPMRILWLSPNLLLPLDKGGKLRTWHLMRHLARRHSITYVSFADPGRTRPRTGAACPRSAPSS